MQAETPNPYAPPTVATIPAAPGVYDVSIYHPAGNGKRFLNFIIDRVAQVLLMAAIGAGLGFLHELGVTAPLVWLDEAGMLADFAFGMVIGIFYYVTLEGLLGWSFGKLITGTRVVDESGSKPTALQILGRSLARFVPFEAFSFLGGRPGGWHDHWSGTLVIDVRNQQPAMSPALRNIYNRH